MAEKPPRSTRLEECKVRGKTAWKQETESWGSCLEAEEIALKHHMMAKEWIDEAYMRLEKTLKSM